MANPQPPAIVEEQSILQFFSSNPATLQRAELRQESWGDPLEATLWGNELSATVARSNKAGFFNVTMKFRHGKILSAFCTCPVGDVLCSHMAQVAYFALEKIRIPVSCTDQPRTWKNPKHGKKAALPELAEVSSWSDKLKPKYDDDDDSNAILDDDLEGFIKAKLGNEHENRACIHWGIPSTIGSSIANNNNAPVSSGRKQLTAEEIEKLKTLTKNGNWGTLTDDDILFIEEATRGQAQNEYWLGIHERRLTASNFRDFMKCSIAPNNTVTYVPLTALRKFFEPYKSLESRTAILYGRTHEKKAIEIYENSRGVSVAEKGIYLDHSGRLGASPDGLSSDGRLVEVKCPYTARDMGVFKWIEESKYAFVNCNEEDKMVAQQFEINGHHVTIFEEGGVYLKSNEGGKKYWTQVQGQLHLTHFKICDFVIFSPKETVIFPISIDEFFGTKLEELRVVHAHLCEINFDGSRRRDNEIP
jgi:hypothetical protein